MPAETLQRSRWRHKSCDCRMFSVMRQKLYDYMAARPGGASSAELLNLLFTSGAGSGLKLKKSEFDTRFLCAAKRIDHRYLKADQKSQSDP